MKIKFKCDQCGQGYAVDPSAASKEAKCVCGHLLTVPRQVAEVEISQTATAGEVARYERINAQLRNERGVPVFPGKLCGTDDVLNRTTPLFRNRKSNMATWSSSKSLETSAREVAAETPTNIAW